MKIHRVKVRTSRGVPYTKTYLIIPKRVEYDMNLKAGQTMFLSSVTPGELSLRKSLKYADDAPVTLAQYNHKKVGQQTYYNLRINIPKQFETRTNLTKYQNCDIYQTGNQITIELENS